jgi:hypothetical protein
VTALSPRRPRISRETRLLLLTIAISITTLWVLARIRFVGRPVNPNPIAPVLTQLAPLPVFDQLSSAMFQIQSRLAPLLFALEVRNVDAAGTATVQSVAALRLDNDTAVALFEGAPIEHGEAGVSVIARDPATGLAVLHLSNGMAPDGPISFPSAWAPRQPQTSRYLIAGSRGSSRTWPGAACSCRRTR